MISFVHEITSGFSIYKTFWRFRRLGKAWVQCQPQGPCTALPSLDHLHWGELRWFHRDWGRSQNSGDCTAFIKLLHFSIYKTVWGFRRLGKARVQGQPPCTALPFLAGSSALGRTQGDSTGTGKGPRTQLIAQGLGKVPEFRGLHRVWERSQGIVALLSEEGNHKQEQTSAPLAFLSAWGRITWEGRTGGSEVGFTVLSAVTDHHFLLAWE